MQMCQNRLKNNEIQIKKAVPRRIRKTALNLNRRMRDLNPQVLSDAGFQDR